jgi:hypothetical protein
MANVGYIKRERTKESDEQYTPAYAVKPIIEYIKPNSVIWCPFDTEQSEYVQLLRAKGFKVISSHIDNGQDFFKYEPEEEYDCIISNAPFSLKDEVLRRLYELNKPFAILLPLSSLQGRKRFKYLEGCQALIFDKRINFFNDWETKEVLKGISFASIYVCKDFLPKDLIFKELIED